MWNRRRIPWPPHFLPENSRPGIGLILSLKQYVQVFSVEKYLFHTVQTVTEPIFTESRAIVEYVAKPASNKSP